MKQDILIGCVADDFTGASDAASFLMSKGMKTILFNGKPDGEIPPCQAVVIALKSRTQETKSAVADSMAAFTWLKEQGAQHLYFKYCSTFDSTKEGNIGPVVDAMLEAFGEKYTILCPALPVNKRTVENGILYVDGVPPVSYTHLTRRLMHLSSVDFPAPEGPMMDTNSPFSMENVMSLNAFVTLS